MGEDFATFAVDQLTKVNALIQWKLSLTPNAPAISLIQTPPLLGPGGLPPGGFPIFKNIGSLAFAELVAHRTERDAEEHDLEALQPGSQRILGRLRRRSHAGGEG